MVGLFPCPPLEEADAVDGSLGGSGCVSFSFGWVFAFAGEPRCELFVLVSVVEQLFVGELVLGFSGTTWNGISMSSWSSWISGAESVMFWPVWGLPVLGRLRGVINQFPLRRIFMV